MKATLIVGAAKEFAGLFRDLIKSKQLKNFENLVEFTRMLEDEKSRPDRDHDDIIVWTRNIKLFNEIFIKEITAKSKK